MDLTSILVKLIGGVVGGNRGGCRRRRVGLFAGLWLLFASAGCGSGAASAEAWSDVELSEGGEPLALRLPAAWSRLATVPASYRAQWRVPGATPDQVAIAGVRALGQQSPTAALADWQTRFAPEPKDNAKTSTVHVPGRPLMTVLEVRGSYAGRADQALIAVVVEFAGAAHLVDLVGPEPVVRAAHETFHRFVASARQLR